MRPRRIGRTGRSRAAPSGRGTVLLVLLSLSMMLYQDGSLRAGLSRATAAFAPFRLSRTQLISLPAMTFWTVALENRTAVLATEDSALALATAQGGQPPRILQAGGLTLRVTGTARQLDALAKGAAALPEALSLLTVLSGLPDNEAKARAQAAIPPLETLCARLDAQLSAQDDATARGLAGLVNACLEAMNAISSAAIAAERFEAIALQAVAYTEYLKAQ